ncbi:unnamed protein product [Parascedosporium putredinis]|uniref:Uncharacterized protein n=1 Tax=Parascedosporium putredinis TaxID=1442378 RepID=A0A9P1MEE5_9PEZI|nr:unnamed protein product [Parascedosporium putredinis]CAI8000297.1 unnamed protein product [Parascedosporium putredinis]
MGKKRQPSGISSATTAAPASATTTDAPSSSLVVKKDAKPIKGKTKQADPAVFFDAIKIRKLVEEATDLSVRAASDGPSHMTAGGFGGGGNGGGGGGGGSAGLGLGPGGPHGPA